jgi:hypothetical protein
MLCERRSAAGLLVKLGNSWRGHYPRTSSGMCRVEAFEKGEKTKGAVMKQFMMCATCGCRKIPYHAESGSCLVPLFVMDALSHFVSIACTLPEALKVAQY